MRKFFHWHRWVRQGTAYNPPYAAGGVSGTYTDILKMSMFGFTNITYTCSSKNCDEMRVETVFGKTD